MEKTVGEIGILNSDLFSDQFFYSVLAGVNTTWRTAFILQDFMERAETTLTLLT
jgi:hypothetical protein